MKITRQKKVKKTLNFYTNNFKFHEPYQILVEGTFTYSALKNKVQIAEQLQKYFQCSVKILTTKCLILELEQLAQQNKKLEGSLKILKQFAIHQCGHVKPIIGAKCIKSMLKDNNSSRYIIATQDRSLQDIIRSTPATPLLYLHVHSPTLEQPSKIDQNYAEELRKKIMLTSIEEESLKKLKKIAGIVENKSNIRIKKKKKVSAPNPLSCLKKKKKVAQEQMKNRKVLADNIIKKPARKKIKISAHVRDELMKEIKKTE